MRWAACVHYKDSVNTAVFLCKCAGAVTSVRRGDTDGLDLGGPLYIFGDIVPHVLLLSQLELQPSKEVGTLFAC